MITSPGRGIVKAVNVAAQAFLRTVAKVVGAEVIDDAIAFFQAFEGMEEGFRERADAVLQLLSDDDTAFVLVASPRRDTIEEARYFAEKLGEADIAVRALIVNRMHPRFGDGLAEATAERAGTFEGTDLGGLYRNLADFQLVASREEEHLAGLAEAVAPAPVVRVPFLSTDVHDLDGLTEVAAPPVLPTHAAPWRTDAVGQAARAGVGAGRRRPSSTVSVTDTMRSKPVVWSRRMRVGRLQATATSPPASRARRMPPISAPSPAESMNGTADRSMSRYFLLARPPRASRNWLTV